MAPKGMQEWLGELLSGMGGRQFGVYGLGGTGRHGFFDLYDLNGSDPSKIKSLEKRTKSEIATFYKKHHDWDKPIYDPYHDPDLPKTPPYLLDVPEGSPARKIARGILRVSAEKPVGQVMGNAHMLCMVYASPRDPAIIFKGLWKVDSGKKDGSTSTYYENGLHEIGFPVFRFNVSVSCIYSGRLEKMLVLRRNTKAISRMMWGGRV